MYRTYLIVSNERIKIMGYFKRAILCLIYNNKSNQLNKMRYTQKVTKFLRPLSFYIFSESSHQDKLNVKNQSGFGPVFTELWVFEGNFYFTFLKIRISSRVSTFNLKKYLDFFVTCTFVTFILLFVTLLSIFTKN